MVSAHGQPLDTSMPLRQKTGDLRSSAGRPISLPVEGPIRTSEHSEYTLRTRRLWGHFCMGTLQAGQKVCASRRMTGTMWGHPHRHLCSPARLFG